MRALIAVFLAAFLCTSPAAAQEQQDPVRECAIRQLQLVTELHSAAHRDGGKLPAGMADAYKKAPSAEWRAAHADYIYLGLGGINISDLPDWGRLALTHKSFSAGHAVAPTPENPDGLLITVGFLDGHVETLTPAEAHRIIDHSKAIFAAIRDNAPLPDREQVLGDLNAIAYAVYQYTRENHGLLPLNQGEIFPRMRAEGRYAAAADRTRAFLIPRARSNTFVPDDPTPEWVMERTSYTYLAGAGLLRDEAPDSQRMVLMHGPLDAEIAHQRRDGSIEKGVPILSVHGRAQLMPRDLAELLIDETKLIFDAMDRGRPLPPYPQARRDLALIGRAIHAYARANEGRLPPDLGATLDYLPPLPKGMTSAQVYLSPRAEASRRDLPAPPTAEWINRHASYKYLGGSAGGTYRQLQRRGINVLVHAPLDEPHDVINEHGTRMNLIPHCDLQGFVVANTPETLEREIPEQIKKINKREETPGPP
jgi:hypothetical protein